MNNSLNTGARGLGQSDLPTWRDPKSGRAASEPNKQGSTDTYITSRASKLDCNVARQLSVRGFFLLSKLLLWTREPNKRTPPVLRPVLLLRRLPPQSRGQRQRGAGLHSHTGGVGVHRQHTACRGMVDCLWNRRVRGRASTA
jgi:hypothetical protein